MCCRVSAPGRRLSLIVVMPASPLEKFLGYGEENSKILYLAEASSNNFSRADPQISELGVSCRPEAVIGLPEGIKALRMDIYQSKFCQGCTVGMSKSLGIIENDS